MNKEQLYNRYHELTDYYEYLQDAVRDLSLPFDDDYYRHLIQERTATIIELEYITEQLNIKEQSYERF
jgi:hypothetical protein